MNPLNRRPGPVAPLLVAPCIALLVLVVGCSGSRGPRLYNLAGAATFDGRPIPLGAITFVPDRGAGNAGPATTAEIKAGRYQTPRGRGVVGGGYRLRISGFDGIPIPSPDGGEQPHGSALFPGRELTVVLPKGGTFDLALEKEPVPSGRPAR